MKAILKIKKLLNGKYMVVIDNGYGRELELTDQISLEAAEQEINNFYNKSEFIIEE
jgi:hypothetical protein